MFVRTLLTALFFSLAACSSAPPEPQVDFNQQYDFKKIKTIAFYHNTGTASGGAAAAVWLNDMVHNRVDEGLKYALKVKGFDVIEDENAADVLIAWHLAAEEKTDVRTYNTGMSSGYGYGSHGRRGGYSCWDCGGTEVRVKQYTQGTLIIDIIDPQLKQSVWRSVVQSKLKGEASQDQQEYNTAALRIMAGFPPHMLAAEPI
jgi:hypothetical protein